MTSYKAITEAPDAAKYPNAARWYKHIASFESEFESLPGDSAAAYTTYGPDISEVTINPAKAPETADAKAPAADDDDIDLFGSDDEEADEEAEKLKAQRLEEYRQKKAGKVKPAAKSIVTLDVKPWGECGREVMLLCEPMVEDCHY